MYTTDYGQTNEPGGALAYYVHDAGHPGYPFNFTKGIYTTGDELPFKNNYTPRFAVLDMQTGKLLPNSGLINYIGEPGQGYYDPSDMLAVVEAANSD